MPRKPIGDVALTRIERQATYRARKTDRHRALVSAIHDIAAATTIEEAHRITASVARIISPDQRDTDSPQSDRPTQPPRDTNG